MLEKKDLLTKNAKKFEKAHAKKKNISTYLQNQKSLEVNGRFIGYAKKAAQLLVPGSEIAVDLTLTGAKLMSQNKFVYSLPDEIPLAAEEKKKIQTKTLYTIAWKTALIAIPFIIPIVRQGALNLCNSIYSK